MAVTMSTVHTQCDAALAALALLDTEKAQVGTDGRSTSIASDIARARAQVESIRESFRAHVYRN